MIALLLAAVVSFTPPSRLSDPIQNPDGTVTRWKCSGDSLSRPLYPADTLWARVTGRDQSRFWPPLSGYWQDPGWWRALWPTVKAGADLRWVRMKRVTAAVRDTAAVPGQRPAYAEVEVRRNSNGNWSCPAGVGVP